MSSPSDVQQAGDRCALRLGREFRHTGRMGFADDGRVETNDPETFDKGVPLATALRGEVLS